MVFLVRCASAEAIRCASKRDSVAEVGPDWVANVQPVVKLLHAGHRFGGVVCQVFHLTSQNGAFQSDFAAQYPYLDIIGVNFEIHGQPVEHVAPDTLVVASRSRTPAVEHAVFHEALISKGRAESCLPERVAAGARLPAIWGRVALELRFGYVEPDVRAAYP